MRNLTNLALLAALGTFSAAAMSQDKPVIPPIPKGQPAPTPDLRTTPLPERSVTMPLPQPGQLPPPDPRMPTSSTSQEVREVPAEPSPPLSTVGETQYLESCGGCHGADGMLNKAKLQAIGRVLRVEGIVAIINGAPPMAKYAAPTMTEEQKIAAATYVHDNLGMRKP